MFMQPETLSDSGGTLVTPEKSGGFSLVGKSTRYPETETLPVGAQARLIRAAMFSEKIGYPLNTLLTINAAHLQRMSSDGVFGVGHLWDGMQNFIELARKWPEKRGVPWVAIWSREHAGGKHGQSGEHWHIGLHLPRRTHADFAEQVARWTDAPIGDTRGANTIARSACYSWDLRTRAPAGRGPDNLAAYLGKAEPSWIRRYGKTVPNKGKPRRDKNGGTGPIQGKRFGMSKSVDTTAQARGFAQRQSPAHPFSANGPPEATQSAA
jgi:hypothetical protein